MTNTGAPICKCYPEKKEEKGEGKIIPVCQSWFIMSFKEHLYDM